MNLYSVPMAGLIFVLSLTGDQLPPPALTFEVASVKPSNPEAHGSTFSFNGGSGLTVKNGTLKGIIETAYDIRDFQISGGPGWINSDHYDITAKNAFDDPQTRATDPAERVKQSRQRLQALLAERFQLKVHRETKDLPEYALVVGKNGTKLQEIKDLPGVGINSNCGRMTGTTMTNLTVVLSRELGRPVLDRTGLAGKYDFKLAWTPDSGPCSQPADGGSPGTAGNLPDGPSIFAALQEQLGLKLESIKGPVEIIVVDHAEKADAN